MPRFKARKLSSLFSSAVKAKVAAAAKTTANTATAATESAAVHHHHHRVSSSSSSSKLSSTAPISTNLRKKKKKKDAPVSIMINQSLHEGAPGTDDSAKEVSIEISSILCGDRSFKILEDSSSESEVVDDDRTSKDDSDSSCYNDLFDNGMILRRKEVSRERKNKWIFKNTQGGRFDKLVSMCLEKLGSGSTYHVLSKLGRDTGLKEYNAFIGGCIETARRSKDEKAQVEQILEIYKLFELMKDRGFPIEEESFGPFLLFLIDMHLTDQFILFLEIVKEEDPILHPRLGYYEMLLWIEIDNDEKIQEICNDIATGESEIGSLLHENYLLALCERDREKELRQLLEIIDITKISSLDNVACIFQSLGRLSLEHFAELFILVLKECDYGSQSISNLIYNYATSMKNLAVEAVILKFKEMHEKLRVELLPGSYEKLITFCCDSRKVHLALDIVDEMCEAGVQLSVERLNSICRACDDTSEFSLVRRIYSMLCDHNLKANSETFRSIIQLYVRMKDFVSAYAILNDLERFNLLPTTSMYNAILAGYYREKNMAGVPKVLGEMKHADVKPDSQTYSYLISNCACEEEIVKYFEELKDAGVQVTKQIYMSLINAYAACGQFEKAKQVVVDKGVPVKYITEIKSVLVSTLASHGKISDALDVYMEIKKSGSCLEPRAIIALIENLQFEGELSILLRLLEEVKDPFYWVEGCCRVISYCVKSKELRSAVKLLKELADHFQHDELAREVIFDEVFSQIADMEPSYLQIGVDLLQAVKEDLKLHPSRKCLDFLLSACVSAKDLKTARFVWKEYKKAGLPYNILSFLRMYQAYLATGELESATSFLSKIPRDDPHVRAVIQACEVTYGTPKDKLKKKKKKKKA